MLYPWLAVIFKATQLGFEALNVMFVLMMRLAAGGARGQSEAGPMVSEKIEAAAEAQANAISGIIAGRKETVVAGRALRGWRKRVRANKRRLARRSTR